MSGGYLHSALAPAQNRRNKIIMKYTIKQLAAELNLSRNTVAKVLNGKSGVSPKTEKLVMDRIRALNNEEEAAQSSETETAPAQNMTVSSEPAQNRGNILFLTRTSFNHSDFWIVVMKGIEKVLKANHYGMVIGIMDNQDIEKLRFPSILTHPDTCGIILVELCDIRVCEAVLSYQLPTVTLDMPREYESFLGKMDIVTMENKKHICEIVSALVHKGFTRFAFAGDLSSGNVSHGFQERYDAVCETLGQYNLSLLSDSCFLRETDQLFLNSVYLTEKLKKLREIPEVYICGNDWTALQLASALQLLGYRIPEDISIVGFDDINEAARAVPPLTTIHTNKEYLGIAAANCILNRITNPDIPYQYCQYMTELMLRKSTVDLSDCL